MKCEILKFSLNFVLINHPQCCHTSKKIVCMPLNDDTCKYTHLLSLESQKMHVISKNVRWKSLKKKFKDNGGVMVNFSKHTCYQKKKIKLSLSLYVQWKKHKEQTMTNCTMCNRHKCTLLTYDMIKCCACNYVNKFFLCGFRLSVL